MPLRCRLCAGTHLNNYNCAFIMRGFDRFWAAYPRKTAKIDARRAWRSLGLSNEEICAVMEGISRYLASGEWRDPQFIPYPATFLNGRRWEDEVGNKHTYDAGMPRYCATCGHTGSWHRNEVKHGRAPGHEFTEEMAS